MYQFIQELKINGTFKEVRVVGLLCIEDTNTALRKLYMNLEAIELTYNGEVPLGMCTCMTICIL